MIFSCSSCPPCGLQAIACDPPPAGRKLGSFFLLDPASIRSKSQYASFWHPGTVGGPQRPPWPLFSRPTLHASSPTIDAPRSSGSAVDVARRAGFSTSHPAGAQHATKRYVFRFFRKFGEPCFRHKLISARNLRLFLAWRSWNGILDINVVFKGSCAVMSHVACSSKSRHFDPISSCFTPIRPTNRPESGKVPGITAAARHARENANVPPKNAMADSFLLAKPASVSSPVPRFAFTAHWPLFSTQSPLPRRTTRLSLRAHSADRKSGLFFLLDPAFIRSKSQYAND